VTVVLDYAVHVAACTALCEAIHYLRGWRKSARLESSPPTGAGERTVSVDTFHDADEFFEGLYLLKGELG
jgi:hypothetical protein